MFPKLINVDWADSVRYAMENFKDETFISQYLTPNVARKLKMFAINDPDIMSEDYYVTEIANESGFKALRQKLADSYALENRVPDIQVTAVDYKGTRKLILDHFVRDMKPLALEDAKKTLAYIADLWEYSAVLKTFEYNKDGDVEPLNLIALGKYSQRRSD
jgi:stage V sporulation protein R